MSKSSVGISRRAYAKSRGISEAAVRKYLAEGKLTEALLPDGTLDPEKADRLLVTSLTRGKNQPLSLSTAKARRLRAQVRKLNDEVEELRRHLITGVDAEKELRKAIDMISRHLRGLVDTIAPIVAGMKGDRAHAAVRDAIYGTLEAIQSDPLDQEFDLDEEEAAEELDLDGLGETELLAKRIDLQADRLELERAQAKGHLLWVEDIIDAHTERLIVCKSLLFALPGRVAAQMEGATVERARAVIAEEMELAIAALG